MTRIAAGHPGIWPDICAENRDAIVEVLDRLIAALSEVRDVVADGDREALLGAARAGPGGPDQPAGPLRPPRGARRAARAGPRPTRRARRGHHAGRRARRQHRRPRDRPLGRGRPRRADPAGRGERRSTASPTPCSSGATGVSERRCSSSTDHDGCTVGPAGPAPPRARVRVPGDKSISHRALILAAARRRQSRPSPVSPTARTCAHTLPRSQALGGDGSSAPTTAVRRPMAGTPCEPPDRPIDVGNSGTGIRLLTGLCRRPAVARHDADRRRVDRAGARWTASPCRCGRWAPTSTAGTGGRLPATSTVTGGALRRRSTYRLPVAERPGEERGAPGRARRRRRDHRRTRDGADHEPHTEELLAPLRRRRVAIDGDTASDRAAAAAGPDRHSTSPCLAIPHRPPSGSSPPRWSPAATWPSRTSTWVPTRIGFLDVLLRMGADLDIDPSDAGRDRSGPSAPRSGAPMSRPTRFAGLVDEVPALAVAAAVAEGRTQFLDAGELRVKESDRIATVAAAVGRRGGDVEPTPDGLVVDRWTRLPRPVERRRTATIASPWPRRWRRWPRHGATDIDGWDVRGHELPGLRAGSGNVRASG